MNMKFFCGGQPGSQGKFSVYVCVCVCVCVWGGGGGGGAASSPIESPLIVMNVNGYNIQQLFPSVYSLGLFTTAVCSLGQYV